VQYFHFAHDDKRMMVMILDRVDPQINGDLKPEEQKGPGGYCNTFVSVWFRTREANMLPLYQGFLSFLCLVILMKSKKSPIPKKLGKFTIYICIADGKESKYYSLFILILQATMSVDL
jgi:hypothetical protein